MESLGLRKTPRTVRKDIESLNSFRQAVCGLYYTLYDAVPTNIGKVLSIDPAKVKAQEDDVMMSYLATSAVASSLLNSIKKQYHWDYDITCDDANNIFYVSIDLSDSKGVSSRHQSFVRAMTYVVEVFHQNIRYSEQNEDQDSSLDRL